ncbi:MAG: pentapeptide repeat-containing protein, partial [Desmonostoc vinosum HA7617-LM4]|nr:pentapeptide repeat-containing protein [Desmonostoc vinosum HA7617-LM4]
MALDFSGQNLQGRNFKGKDLAGANFSYTDIRGANFTNANLKGANFSHAQAGLRSHSIIILVLTSLVVSTTVGIFLPYFGANTVYLLINGKDPIGLVVIVVLTGFFIFLFAIRQQSVLTALIVVTLGAAITGMKAMAASLAASVVVTVAVVVVAVVASKVAIAVTIAAVVIAAMTTSVTVFAKIGAVAGGAVTTTVATVALLLYMSWRVLAGDEKYVYILRIAIACGDDGTSFRSANLTDANFTQAILKNTDFRNANLTRTCWFQAQKLDFADVWKTYLEKSLVRQLVTTREGQDKNFDGLSLRSVNLCNANLKDTSFIGADLSEANLQDADLSRAKLKQTQLDATDLTGATLTG